MEIVLNRKIFSGDFRLLIGICGVRRCRWRRRTCYQNTCNRIPTQHGIERWSLFSTTTQVCVGWSNLRPSRAPTQKYEITFFITMNLKFSQTHLRHISFVLFRKAKRFLEFHLIFQMVFLRSRTFGHEGILPTMQSGGRASNQKSDFSHTKKVS